MLVKVGILCFLVAFEVSITYHFFDLGGVF